MKPILLLLMTGLVFSGPLEDLQPGQWYEAPNSHMASVGIECGTECPECPDHWPAGTNCTNNSIGVRGVMSLWSGGAYDTKRDRLIVWGGGHAGYAGNEIYVFDVNTLQWTRVNDPSVPPASDTPYAADGGPCSRHTYNYIQYVPAIDRFCSFGGAGFFPSGQTGTIHTDCFDFDAKTWEQMADTPTRGIGAISAVDPVSGDVFVKGTGTNWITARWDPAADTWTNWSTLNNNGRYDYSKTAAIDPVNRVMVAVGGGEVYAWDIGGTPPVTQQDVTTSGDQTAVNDGCPGFDYDAVSGKFVAWTGGQNIYTLDWSTKAWTRVNGSGADPGPSVDNGTYGRFRYVPSKNVFVVVNTITTNVFFFRLTAGTGVARAPLTESALSITATPNPFNAAVIISMAIHGRTGGIQTTMARNSWNAAPTPQLAIYDIHGRMVHASAEWDGSQYTWKPARLPAGVYMARVAVGNRVMTKQLLLMK